MALRTEARPMCVATGSTGEAERIHNKIARRLIPFMFVLYIVAYLDRINLGFAAAQMKVDVGFSDADIGGGAGIFFIGYFLFGVPANLILVRVGARRWIAAIMGVWGLLSAATALVGSMGTFLTLRFLLGVAEAGFFPGMIFYLTCWFPQRERARAVAMFMTAIPCAGVVGGLISGALLQIRGGGLAGWQWLFILEGIPAIVCAALVLGLLPDGPEQATWLTAAEREWLVANLARDRARQPADAHHAIAAVRDIRVWLLALLYFCVMVNLYGFSLWLPQMLGVFSLSENVIGHLSALPYFIGAVGMVLIGSHSDGTGERRWHVAGSALVGACGFLLAPLAPNPLTAVLALSLAGFGVFGTFGPFWALPTSFLGKSGAASGIALINAIGNLGGSVGGWVVGLLKQGSRTFASGFVLLAAILVVAAVLAVTLRVASETDVGSESEKPRV